MHRATIFLVATSVGLLISVSAVTAQNSGTTQGNADTSGNSSVNAHATGGASSSGDMNDTVDMGSYDEGGPVVRSGSRTHHKAHQKKRGSDGISKGENGGAQAKPNTGNVQ